MKQNLLKYIEDIKETLLTLGDFIFDTPEIELQEFESSKKITEFLKENGFEI